MSFFKKYFKNITKTDNNVKLIEPNIKYYNEYFNLCSDSKISTEFLDLRNSSLEESKAILDYWQKNDEYETGYLFKLISYQSEIVGFIANSRAGIDDESKSGFRVLINYGILQSYVNKGIMTKALKLFTDEMYEKNYNIVSAFVKPNNIASEKVLMKNGFDLVTDNLSGKSFVKALKIDIKEYKEAFNL